MMVREPWSKSAQEVILAVAEEKIEGFITTSSLTDIHYLLRKHLGDKSKTKQALLGLLSIVSVLDVNGVDCEKAFDLPMADYEDALLAQCGKRHKVGFIVTRNANHYEGSPVKAVNLDEILGSIIIRLTNAD